MFLRGHGVVFVFVTKIALLQNRRYTRTVRASKARLQIQNYGHLHKTVRCVKTEMLADLSECCHAQHFWLCCVRQVGN